MMVVVLVIGLMVLLLFMVFAVLSYLVWYINDTKPILCDFRLETS